MARAKLTLNERSWAIDVITEINNNYLNEHHRAIRRAKGELTLAGGDAALFPDVLLFGDEQQGLVLQAWELKMPDTPLTDPQLFKNAEEKSRRLNLKSFVLWNVREAVLYHLNDTGVFVPERGWGPIGIKTREEVAAGKCEWCALLHQILDDLNDIFEERPTAATTVSDALHDRLFADMIDLHRPLYADSLSKAQREKSKFRAQVDLWWMENRHNHPGISGLQALAEANILNWLNKLIFAHCLKRFHDKAFDVDEIVRGTTVDQAQKNLANISAACDFMAVFQNMLGQEYVDKVTWQSLLDVNALLISARFDAVDPSLLSQTLDGTVERSRRKAFGQFVTPAPLANFLVRIAVDGIGGTLLDPCCGAGTIARAAYQWKKSENISPKTALKQIWAGDKFTFPLQLATMALADPAAIGTPLNIFCRDALNLAPDQKIPLTDPSTGESLDAKLPHFDCIVSNLPFVRFETLGTQQRGGTGAGRQPKTPGLDSKSDLFAHLLINFKPILKRGARVGVIVANSWLGTDWGRKFRQELGKDYYISAVVTSANGRWFRAADVVTNILLLERRGQRASKAADRCTNFIATLEPLEEWDQVGDGIKELAGHAVLASRKKPGRRLHISSFSAQEIEDLENLGLQWTAYFATLDFISKVRSSLVPANTLFNINRGERRGWDELFYPPPESKIEPIFLKAVLKNSKQLSRLIAVPAAQAFCCSVTLEKLRSQGNGGALAWINTFEKQTNGAGKPLPEVLHRPGCQWYEMKPSTLADFAIPINPDARLCVFRLEKRAFVNQRFIRFTFRQPNGVDAELLHALMNSTLGMFLIEAAGFGRGLGALDLNATKLSETFHILNPGILKARDIARIKKCFRPLLARDIGELPTEITHRDRLALDACVAQAYGFSDVEPEIRDALEFLYKIRKSVKY